MKRIFTGLPLRTADLILLILASQNIRAGNQRSRGIDILTASDQAEEATSQVAAYFRETDPLLNRYRILRQCLPGFRLPQFS